MVHKRTKPSSLPRRSAYEAFVLERIAWHVSGSILEFSDYQMNLRAMHVHEAERKRALKE